VCKSYIHEQRPEQNCICSIQRSVRELASTKSAPVAEALHEGTGWLAVRTGDNINLLEGVAHGKRGRNSFRLDAPATTNGRAGGRAERNATQLERKNKSMQRRMKEGRPLRTEPRRDGKTRCGGQTRRDDSIKEASEGTARPVIN